MASQNALPSAPGHSLLLLMLMGLLSGIISAFIAATTMLALSERQVLGTAAGSAIQNYADDLPTAVIAAFLWFLPMGIFMFPPAAKFLGAASGSGTLRLLMFVILAAAMWCLLAEVIYLILSPLAPAPPGVQRHDLISAALSGVLFAVVYDLLLRRRDYLVDRSRR